MHVMYLYDALQLFHVQPLRLNQFIHYVTVEKDEKSISIWSYKGQHIGVTKDSVMLIKARVVK